MPYINLENRVFLNGKNIEEIFNNFLHERNQLQVKD